MMTFAPSLPPEEEGAARRVASVDDGCTVTVVAPPPPPPRRRGRLAIVSADPATPPAIHLGREDESAALAALRLPRRFVGEPFVPFATGAARPTHAVANTCRMGAASDPGAVVDASLRVRGVRGVRVVGAAVAPSALAAGAHSAAPTVAIAERAADIIAKDAAHAETRGGREKKKKAARETDEADEAERADAETQTEDEATRRVVSVSVSRAPEAGFRPRDLESDPASEAASSAASSGVASPDTPRRREASPPPTPPTSPPRGGTSFRAGGGRATGEGRARANQTKDERERNDERPTGEATREGGREGGRDPRERARRDAEADGGKSRRRRIFPSAFRFDAARAPRRKPRDRPIPTDRFTRDGSALAGTGAPAPRG